MKAWEEHPLWVRGAGGSSPSDAMHRNNTILHRSEYGSSPYTLTRKLQRVSRDEVWNALSVVVDSMLDVKENLLIADFTHLDYTGKRLLSLITGTKNGYRVICYLAPVSMLEFKEDLRRDFIQREGSGRVFVSDA